MGGSILVDRHGVPARQSTLLGLGRHYEGARANKTGNAAWRTSAVAGASEARHDRTPIAARARDLIRNNPTAATALRKMMGMLIGPGFRLSSKPDARGLGVDPVEALAFGREIEKVWHRWAYGQKHNCDIRGRSNYGKLSRVRAADRYVTGESFHIHRWREDRVDPSRGLWFATCLQLVDGDRISNPDGRMDQPHLRDGLDLDDDGMVYQYWARDRHPADPVTSADRWTWTPILRIDEDGRRVMVHSYSEMRSEQLRGVSPFAPILMRLKETDRYITAELGAAIINALLTGFVKTSSSPELVAEALGMADDATRFVDWSRAREEVYGEQGIGIGENRFAFLGVGDDVEIPNTSRQTTSVPEFKKSQMRDVAGPLGHGYAALSGDYESMNYSSSRAEMAEIWRGVLQEREEEIDATVRPDFAAIVEEAFDRGYLVEPDGWPSFENEGDAYLNATFTGPGRGYVDPVKEAQGNQIQLEQGSTTLEEICASQGKHWRDVLAQRRIEKDELEALGLEELNLEAALLVASQTEKEENQ